MAKSVLVTGGAGYIGSNVTHNLIRQGYLPIVLDNLDTGDQRCLPEGVVFVEGDIGNSSLVSQLVREHKISSLLHFAAHIEVEESVHHPDKYYRNNTMKALELFSTCLHQGVEKMVFSSTAAVYGEAGDTPIGEDSPQNPINPYGRSKWMSEKILRDLVSAHSGSRFVILRYFNVAGAHPDGWWGQTAKRATHLVRLAAQTALGYRPHLSVFGNDYPTVDGTCVRDYIHVQDLAWAHILALRNLETSQDSHTLNCGYGRGFSVRQVIEAMKSVSGNNFATHEEPRRAGDPASLVADASRIRELLKWHPEHESLELICQTALDWERRFNDFRR